MTATSVRGSAIVPFLECAMVSEHYRPAADVLTVFRHSTGSGLRNYVLHHRTWTRTGYLT